MKKLILLIITLICFQPESEASDLLSYNSNHKTSVSAATSTSNTSMRRRRKKGFLWGLFKKKDCGCPKH
ncbi:hypothetical protein [Pseudarcicella hirudinis]|uniref:hypothetical protein n=1 Tax=Pseudarcicella hirudinis TaxID=1079859 RepID=UPI001160A3FD|nr:hypothetical protein [Pseudarcicella hirudinis]